MKSIDVDGKSGAVKVPESKITQELIELIQENIQSGLSACFTIVLILFIASCVLVIFGIWFTLPILSIVNNVTGFAGLFDWLPLATISRKLDFSYCLLTVPCVEEVCEVRY